MTKKLFISAMALSVCALAFVSCAKENLNEPSKQDGITVFTATSGTVISKTSISDGKVSWTENDPVSIFWGTDGKATGYADATGESCNIKAEGVADADNYYAFYPAADEGVTVSEGTVTFTVPAVSTGVFADANMAYASTTREEKAFSFNNVTGLVHFSVKDGNVTKVVFKAGTAVAGTVTATIDKQDGVVFGAASETADAITVAVDDRSDVYFSVLAGAVLENGFTAVCYNGDIPVSVVSSTTPVTIRRAEIWDLGEIDSHIVTDYFVTPEGAGKKTGKSWDNAMDAAGLGNLLATPAAAEDKAIQAVKLNATNIHLAAGEYLIAGDAGMCAAEFDETVQVNIIGGYPTTLTGKTTDAVRDTSATILSGNKTSGILSLKGKLDFSFDGITFKDAYSNNNGYKAFSITESSSNDAKVSFNHCTFLDNIEENTLPNGMGAVVKGATAIFENCTFSGNKSRNGSAIDMGESAVVTVSKCKFEGNHSYNTSGAVQNGGATLTMNECLFSRNTAAADEYSTFSGLGGAFHTNGEGATSTITDCVFDSNEGNKGGAISIQVATVTLEGCTFTGNYSVGGGGAIYVIQNASAKFDGCTFTGNTTDGTDCHGGVGIIENGSIEFKGCNFSGNRADGTRSNGGVLLFNDGNLIVDNCTFSDNTATNNGGCFRVQPSTANTTVIFKNNSSFEKCEATFGGAINFAGSVSYTAKVENCTFTENTVISYAGALQVNNSSLDAVISDCTFTKNFGVSYPTVYIENGKASLDNCTFDSNYGKDESVAKGIALAVRNSSVAKLNNCQILNNNTGNRGAIFLENNAVVYLNGCLFDGNNVNGAWGNCFHIGGNNAVLMNDCTLYNNPGQYDINCDGYILIANTTIISQATNTVFRQGKSGKKVYMINNILSGPSNKNIFALSTGLTNGGHNVLSATNGSGYTANATDYIGTVPGASYENGKYLWSGPANISGFTQATASEVKNAIKTGFNVTVNGISNIGNDFCTWVEGVNGFRTAENWWPGAYQQE